MSRAHAQQQEKPMNHNWRKPTRSNEEPTQPKIKKDSTEAELLGLGSQEWVGICQIQDFWGALQSEAKASALAFTLTPTVSSSKYAFKQVSLYRHLRKSTSYSLLPSSQSSVGTHRNIQNE